MIPVAIVTGGGAGLGLATATLLHERGHAVVLADVDLAAATDAADKLGEDALAVRCDVADGDSVDAMVATAVERFGRIDVLVNNAGIIDPSPTAETTDVQWDRMLGIHLGGAFRCSRAAYPFLKVRGGAIVSISSVNSSRGFPMRASYAAAKNGIEALTRVLAVEWAGDGIRVNAVSPGFMQTAMGAAAAGRGLIDSAQIVEQVPLRRLGVPRDVAATVAFLVSDDSAYLTGQTLVVDGGLTVSAASWARRE